MNRMFRLEAVKDNENNIVCPIRFLLILALRLQPAPAIQTLESFLQEVVLDQDSIMMYNWHITNDQPIWD